MQSQAQKLEDQRERERFIQHMLRIFGINPLYESLAVRFTSANDLIRDNLHYWRSSSLVLLPERRSYLAIGTFRNKIDFSILFFMLGVCFGDSSFHREAFTSAFDESC